MRSKDEIVITALLIIMGELELTDEEATGLLFRITAGLAAVMEAGGETPPDFAALKARAKGDLAVHLTAWANAAKHVAGAKQ